MHHLFSATTTATSGVTFGDIFTVTFSKEKQQREICLCLQATEMSLTWQQKYSKVKGVSKVDCIYLAG